MNDEILVGGAKGYVSRMRQWGAMPNEGFYVTNKRIIGTKEFSLGDILPVFDIIEGPFQRNKIDNLTLDQKIEIIKKLERELKYQILKEDIIKIEMYSPPRGWQQFLHGGMGKLKIFCKSGKEVNYIYNGNTVFNNLTDIMQRFFPDIIIHK